MKRLSTEVKQTSPIYTHTFKRAMSRCQASMKMFPTSTDLTKQTALEEEMRWSFFPKTVTDPGNSSRINEKYLRLFRWSTTMRVFRCYTESFDGFYIFGPFKKWAPVPLKNVANWQQVKKTMLSECIRSVHILKCLFHPLVVYLLHLHIYYENIQ